MKRRFGGIPLGRLLACSRLPLSSFPLLYQSSSIQLSFGCPAGGLLAPWPKLRLQHADLGKTVPVLYVCTGTARIVHVYRCGVGKRRETRKGSSQSSRGGFRGGENAKEDGWVEYFKTRSSEAKIEAKKRLTRTRIGFMLRATGSAL